MQITSNYAPRFTSYVPDKNLSNITDNMSKDEVWNQLNAVSDLSKTKYYDLHVTNNNGILKYYIIDKLGIGKKYNANNLKIETVQQNLKDLIEKSSKGKKGILDKIYNDNIKNLKNVFLNQESSQLEKAVAVTKAFDEVTGQSLQIKNKNEQRFSESLWKKLDL